MPNERVIGWRVVSRVSPLGKVHVRQTGTVAVNPGVVVCRPQSAEPLGVETAARVEPAYAYNVHGGPN